VNALRKRSDLDPNCMSDVMLLDLALGQNDITLELLPKLCAAGPIICADISLFPGWIPLRGQPAFEALVKKYDTVSQPPASAASSPSSS